jgi:hypothetical protein
VACVHTSIGLPCPSHPQPRRCHCTAQVASQHILSPVVLYYHNICRVAALLAAKHAIEHEGRQAVAIVAGDTVASPPLQDFLARADGSCSSSGSSAQVPSPVIPNLYDRVAQWHMQQYGTTREQLVSAGYAGTAQLQAAQVSLEVICSSNKQWSQVAVCIHIMTDSTCTHVYVTKSHSKVMKLRGRGYSHSELRCTAVGNSNTGTLLIVCPVFSQAMCASLMTYQASHHPGAMHKRPRLLQVTGLS